MAQRAGNKEFAVIGLGRFGASVALTLVQRGYNVLGIDSDPDLVQRYADELAHTVALDATDEEALEAVEIGAFDTVIVAIGDNFESSVLATVVLKQMGVRSVVCKANSEREAEVLRRVGADRVVLPEVEAGQRLAQELSSPRLLDQMPMKPGYSIAEVRAPAPLAGKTIMQSDLRRRSGLLILAVKSGDNMIVSPPGEYIIRPQDVLVLLGPDASISKFSADR